MGLFKKSRLEYRLVPPQTPEEEWERYWNYERPRTRRKIIMWGTIIGLFCVLLTLILQR